MQLSYLSTMLDPTWESQIWAALMRSQVAEPGHSCGLCSDAMSDETSIPHIDFSPATDEDYEELMFISSGIYNGMDFLPFWYHSWLKEPNRRMIVAKCEGKVVGFISFILVDDGTTAVSQGLRVAPWIRNRGVAALITSFLCDTLYSHHPKVKKIRFARMENPPAALLKKTKLIDSKMNEG
ncbi:probable N-acetyltransferase 16 [Bufo bufo]|uniref:probable N-acetyltransferase 16 n=1 Tax=Bufo bufo TaxID=8384 RepID=UPI001ABDCF1E|nr:probable N-acetyltransferase 16 [Bufo bufo]